MTTGMHPHASSTDFGGNASSRRISLVRVVSPLECPWTLTAAFWIGWILTAVIAISDGSTRWPPLGAVLLLLCAEWTVLPWTRVRGARALLPVALLLTTLLLSLVGPNVTFVSMTVTALANLVFTLGLGAAVTVAGLQLMALTAAIWFIPETRLDALVSESLSFAALMAFAIAMAAGMVEHRAGRQKAEALVLQVQELTVSDERARMARDVHDSLGHSLTVVKLALDAAQRIRADGATDRAWAEVQHAGELTALALADTRRWVRALHPLALAEGLNEDTLRELAESFSGTGLRVDHEVHGDPGRLSPRVALVAYRVVQEGLTNAVRHSQADAMKIALMIGPTTVTATITDEGSGVDGDPMSGSFGLAALAERVSSVGGVLVAGNGPDGGFRVRAVLPLATP